MCSDPTPSLPLPLHPERHQPSPRLSERPSLLWPLQDTCSPSLCLAGWASFSGHRGQTLSCAFASICPLLVRIPLLSFRAGFLSAVSSVETVCLLLPLPAPWLSHLRVPNTCIVPGRELMPTIMCSQARRMSQLCGVSPAAAPTVWTKKRTPEKRRSQLKVAQLAGATGRVWKPVFLNVPGRTPGTQVSASVCIARPAGSLRTAPLAQAPFPGAAPEPWRV